MLKQFNFQGVVPSGSRAPGFPAGPHLTVISKVEDAEAKDGVVGGFWVTFSAHPQHRAPGVTGAEQFRRWFAYEGKALGFSMKLFMIARGWTQEQLQNAAALTFDPCDPNQGLLNRVVPILSKPGSRTDSTDPNKKYDDADILDMEEYQKALVAQQQEANAVAQAAAVTLPTTPAVPAQTASVPAAAAPVAAIPQGLPAGLPNANALPNPAMPANTLPPGLAAGLPQLPTA